jgi:hypothetical protein
MERLQPLIDKINQYPTWLVILCGTVVASVLLYLLSKTIKWMIYIAIVCVVVGGVAAALYYLLK